MQLYLSSKTDIKASCNKEKLFLNCKITGQSEQQKTDADKHTAVQETAVFKVSF